MVKVRAFCLDPLSKSNWTEVMEMVRGLEGKRLCQLFWLL